MTSRQDLIHSVHCIIDRARHCIFRAQDRGGLSIIVTFLTEYMEDLYELVDRLSALDTTNDDDVYVLRELISAVDDQLVDLEQLI